MDIVSLAQRYSVRPNDLRRSGRIYFIPCICPLRNRDSNPSVALYVEEQRYWCYACQRGGSAVKLVAHAENCSLREAYRRLREITGTHALSELIKPATRTWAEIVNKETSAWAREKLAILAEIYNQQLLRLSRKHPAWQYLAHRGVTEETVHRLKIGWTPKDERPLFNGLSAKELRELGALTEEDKPVLRRRIVFPIWNNDEVVYLIGRRLEYDKNNDKSNAPKYLGLRSTEHVAKMPFMRGVPEEGSVLVEGILDAIAILQSRLASRWRVIATLGFDERRVDALISASQVGRRFVIALDQDEAGRRFALQLADHLRARHPELVFYIAVSQDAPLQESTYPALSIPASFKDFGDLMNQTQLIEAALAHVGRPPLAIFMQRYLAAHTPTNSP